MRSLNVFLVHIMLVALIGAGFILATPQEATAQTWGGILPGDFQCAGAAPRVRAGVTDRLFVNPNYTLTATQQCARAGGFFGIFDTLICQYENTLNSVMSTMFCSLREMAFMPVKLALTFFLILYAVSFMFGISDFTAKEVMIRLIKFTLVFAFVTDAQWAIGVAYTFFIGASQEGIRIATSQVIVAGGTVTGGGALTTVGQIAAVNPNAIVDAGPPPVTAAAAALINPLALSKIPYNAVSANMNALINNSMISWFASLNPLFLGVLIVIMIIVFPVGMLVVSVISQFLMLVARAILGYLLSITMITFLMVLSPIFITFSLFQTTAEFFNKWIMHLTSFSMQMVILFIFISLMEVVDIGNYLQRVSNLARMYHVDVWLGPIHFPLPMPTLCRYQYQDSLGNWRNVTNGLVRPALGAPWEPVDPAKYNTLNPRCLAPAGPADPLKDDLVIPPLTLGTQTEFIANLAINIISLLILGQVMDRFLMIVPEVARSLAGLALSGRLGGVTSGAYKIEAGNINMTGAAAFRSARQGFFEGAMRAHGLGTTKTYAGLIGAYQALKGGEKSQAAQKTRRQSRGLYMDVLMEARNLGQSPADIRRRGNRSQDIFGTPLGGEDDQEVHESTNLFGNDNLSYSQKLERKRQKQVERENAARQGRWYYFLTESPDGKSSGGNIFGGG